MPDISVFRNAVEVSDLELGIQRGRYVARGQIMYFGVEMNTEWRTASGQLYRSGLHFGVDRHAGRFKPVVTIVHQNENARTPPASIPASPASTPAATISTGGLDTVKGVGQVVQVTGDTNSVRNDISLNLRTTSSETPESPAAVNSRTAGSPSPAGASAVAGQGGDPGKSLGVTVAVPGQGVASQSISSLGGLRQNVRLTGDMNSVLNQLNLTAEFRAVSNPGVRHMRSSFQSMRGLPQAGMF